MINKKEITIIILATIILGFTISLIKTIQLFLYILLSIFLILIINIIAKKITSYYLDSEIEIKLWTIKRYGFKPNNQFKRPFPAGAFLPIILTTLSFGNLTWMAPLTFEIKPKIYKAAKRHGLYSFSEITESHVGIIASIGILANLIFAIAGYLIGLPPEMNFVKLSIFYTFFNLLPISDLDGNKIFFGNLVIWSFLSSLILIALGYAFLII